MNVTPEKHAPSKARYTRANQAPYVNKKLSKGIMRRSRLRNKFLRPKVTMIEKHIIKKEVMWLVY